MALERDKVKARLEHLIEASQHMRSHFISQTTHINLVMNNDRMSSSESVRLRKKLKDIGLTIRHIIITKDSAGVTTNTQNFEFKSEMVIRSPFSDTPSFYGLDNLDNYLKGNPETACLARNATVCKIRFQFQKDFTQRPRRLLN